MSESNSSSSGFGVLGWLGVAFIILKLIGTITWSWWWVTIPFWGGAVGFLVIVAISFIIMKSKI